MKKLSIALCAVLLAVMLTVSASAAPLSANPATGDISMWLPFLVIAAVAVVVIVLAVVLGKKKSDDDDDDEDEFE